MIKANRQKRAILRRRRQVAVYHGNGPFILRPLTGWDLFFLSRYDYSVLSHRARG